MCLIKIIFSIYCIGIALVFIVSLFDKALDHDFGYYDDEAPKPVKQIVITAFAWPYFAAKRALQYFRNS